MINAGYPAAAGGGSSFSITGGAPVANEWVVSITAAGVVSLSQPAAANLSDGTTGTGAIVLADSPTFTSGITANGFLTSVISGQGMITFYPNGGGNFIESTTSDGSSSQSLTISGPLESDMTDLFLYATTIFVPTGSISVGGIGIACNALYALTINPNGSLTITGNPAFTGTPTFSNPVALGSSTATTQSPGTDNTTIATTQFVTTAVAGGGGGGAFSAITTGINTSATMTVGPGSTLTFSGAGSPPYEGEINANFLYGVQIEPYAPTVGQVLTAISTTAAQWQSLPASSVISVFGRTGAVIAVSGDYTVAQVTGAAALAGPTFTGTVTIPTLSVTTVTGNPSFTGTPTFSNALALGSSTATTQSPGTSNTTIATTQFVNAAVAAGGGGGGGGSCNVISGTGIVVSSALAGSPAVETFTVSLAVAAIHKYAASIGNGSDTSFLVTHSLSTTDVVVMAYSLNPPNAVVDVEIEITDSNDVTLNFATAPTANSVRVIVIG